MSRFKLFFALVVCVSWSVSGITRVFAEESLEAAINRENRLAMQSEWTGSVKLSENSCYYRSWPERKINFKTKGKKVGTGFKLNGFQKDSFTLQKYVEGAPYEISFVRSKRDRYGRLKNCLRYEWLTFDSFVNSREASVTFHREYHCGGIYLCSTVFTGTGRRRGKSDLSGLYEGELSASSIDSCDNEDISEYWHRVWKANDGSLRYTDGFVPSDTSVPLEFDPSTDGTVARYSFTWVNPSGQLCNIDAVYEGSYEGPGKYSPSLDHTYTCGSRTYTCSWWGYDVVRRQ